MTDPRRGTGLGGETLGLLSRNPLLTLLVSMGVGLLLGRLAAGAEPGEGPGEEGREDGGTADQERRAPTPEPEEEPRPRRRGGIVGRIGRELRLGAVTGLLGGLDAVLSRGEEEEEEEEKPARRGR